MGLITPLVSNLRMGTDRFDTVCEIKDNVC